MLALALILGVGCKKSTAPARSSPAATATNSPSFGAPDFDRAAARKAPDTPVLLPVFPTNQNKMGWTKDDETYLASIPEAARRVPQGLVDGRMFFDDEAGWRATMSDPRAVTSAKGVLTFRAYETSRDGRYVLRKIARGTSGPYDQWFLLDAPRFTRAVISVHRETKRAYFFQIASFREPGREKWEIRRSYLIGEEHCYSCHPTGLREVTVREDDPEVDRALLKVFNEAIEDTGRFDYGDDVNLAAQGPHVTECTDCHDGEDRGRLYPVHLQVARFKLKRQQVMPPDGPLPAREADAILERMRKDRAKLFGLDDGCP